MKITTLEVLQWNPSTEEYESVYEEAYEYEGEVAEAKSSSPSAPPATTTTTSTTKPFAEQLPFVKRVFSEAESLFNQGAPQFFPGSTVAPFSGATLAGFSSQLNAANALQAGLIPQTTQALQGLLAAPDPSRDPTVQAFADAAVRPLEQRLTNQILPSIRSSAVQAGAFGGSRQGIVENQALNEFARTAGDVRAGIFNNAFNQQLEAQQRALALAPQIASLTTLPGQLQTQVGAAQENVTQQQINEAIARFNFQQDAPFLNLQRFSNLINQFGGSTSSGTATTSGLVGPQRGGLTGALGGASTGAALGSIVPGIGTGIGAGIGGLIGLLGF